MKALIIFAGFVIASTAGSVLVGSYIERLTSPQIGLIVILGLFFTSLVVSWIATILVMDGSLKDAFAEKEQLEAERIGRESIARTDPEAR